MFIASVKRLFIFCVLFSLLFAFSAHAAEAEKKASKRRVEVAFVLDTTGSMSSLIEGAKKKIWAIANTIVDQYPDAEIRFGLVGYRDIDDAYVTKFYPLTTDIQEIYGHLLQFKADGGGDTPESVNEALHVAITKLGWTEKSQVKADRILFLVGDAPPHMDYKQDRKYPETLKDAAKMGIIVNAVQAGDSSQTRTVWKEIADLGKGDYLAIPQDGGRVIVIETPYDKDINKIQIELNSTVIIYGSVTQQKETERKTSQYAQAAPAASADMASFVNKSAKGSAVVTGRGDLVADLENDHKKLSDVKDAELPENMQKMSAPERQQYITANAEKRKELAKKLAEAVAKRDEFIKQEQAKEPKGAGDSFDQSVTKSITKQLQ